MITGFALTIGRIQQRGYGSGEGGGVVGGAEFPAITEKDGNDIAWLESGGDESTGQGFDGFAVFGVGDAAVAGGVNNGSLVGKAAAAFEDEIVDEAAGWVGVELSAEHAEEIVAESRASRRFAQTFAD